MTARQVRDEVMTLFMAGHETTAVALSWTWYLLAQHPEVDARLGDELRAVLGARAPTVADLPRLKYAEMIVSEPCASTRRPMPSGDRRRGQPRCPAIPFRPASS